MKISEIRLRLFNVDKRGEWSPNLPSQGLMLKRTVKELSCDGGTVNSCLVDTSLLRTLRYYGPQLNLRRKLVVLLKQTPTITDSRRYYGLTDT